MIKIQKELPFVKIKTFLEQLQVHGKIGSMSSPKPPCAPKYQLCIPSAHPLVPCYLLASIVSMLLTLDIVYFPGLSTYIKMCPTLSKCGEYFLHSKNPVFSLYSLIANPLYSGAFGGLHTLFCLFQGIIFWNHKLYWPFRQISFTYYVYVGIFKSVCGLVD